MGVITTGSIAKALWPGVNKWFGMAYDEHKPEWPDLFDTETSDKKYEEDALLSGFGLAAVKPEGESVSYADQVQSWIKRYTHVVYALGFIITEEAIEDNQYADLARKRTRALAFSMRQTKEIVGANVYNRAFNSSYTGGDAKELCATDHPSPAGTWSNELNPAADLSEDALEDLVTQIYSATDDNGLKISLQPKSLIVSASDWFEANRIVKSVLQNDSPNNAINVLKATNVFPDGIKLNHFLTDTDAFFVRTNCPDGLKCFSRRPVRFAEDNDFDTANLKYKADERYAMGWTDPRGLYASSGA